MVEVSDNITKTTYELNNIAIRGSIIPHNWYEKIVITTKKGTSKVDSIGILLLARLIDWYQLESVLDERSGMPIGYHKSFKEDKLQVTYTNLASHINVSKGQVMAAVKRLKSRGLITVEYRQLLNEDTRYPMSNVLCIEPVPESIRDLMYSV